MKTQHLLVCLSKPATIFFPESLPDNLFLRNAAGAGGFHPCGMWDLVINPVTLEWLGIVYYLSTVDAIALRDANPEFDSRVIRLLSLDTMGLSEAEIQECKRNGTSNLLQLTWSDSEPREILPALEMGDFWYALKTSRSAFEKTDSLSPANVFLALGILSARAKMDAFGLKWPKVLNVPVVDSVSGIQV